MEQTTEIERSQIWKQIHEVVNKIPRKNVEGDAMDAASAATEIEQLLFQKKTTEYTVRYPIAFHTVDVAVVKTDHDHNITHVLLIQKPHEVSLGIWRFPGGFIDPTDKSAEEAGAREVKEETGMDVFEMNYIGSSNIDDPRYRDTPHGIITSFFYAIHKDGEAGQGFDDVAVTKWFDVKELYSPEFKINPTHAPLFAMFKELVDQNQ
jgi:ADP-ribose pyrophosphatase YjhB (NUDIX family)